MGTAITLARELITRRNTVTLEWCPGHVGIQGNEEADILAKKATSIPTNKAPASISYYRSVVKAESLIAWKEKLKSTPDSPYKRRFGLVARRRFNPPTNSREIASAYYQLKIGHGYFKSYLYRFNLSEDDKCRCNRTTAQTPHHLLTECRLYKDLRVPIKEALGKWRLDPKDLYSTKLGRDLLVKFLEKSKIATRRWQLNDLPDEV